MQLQQIILKIPKQLGEYQYILFNGNPKKGQGVGDRWKGWPCWEHPQWLEQGWAMGCSPPEPLLRVGAVPRGSPLPRKKLPAAETILPAQGEGSAPTAFKHPPIHA